LTDEQEEQFRNMLNRLHTVFSVNTCPHYNYNLWPVPRNTKGGSTDDSRVINYAPK
jgi:hypothetical protein